MLRLFNAATFRLESATIMGGVGHIDADHWSMKKDLRLFFFVRFRFCWISLNK